MGGLFAILDNGSGALQAFQRSLDVTQNNVSNASTPGYARQTQELDALAFQPSAGLIGGVTAGAVQSSRSEYAEQGVRSQQELLGNFTAQAGALSSIVPVFDVSGSSGIDGALNNLFQSFSSWASTPGDPNAQQDVIAKAQAVSAAFQDASASLSKSLQGVNQDLTSTVSQINTLAQQIAGYNDTILKGGPVDAGVDANLHSALETLSGLADVTVRFETNGTATVLLGGQTALVIGNQADAVSLNLGNTATLTSSDGTDITSQISQGTLGGLLTIRNTTLPSIIGDGTQQGSLNQLAQQVADRVNQILQAGQISSGPPAVAGQPLFAYTASSPASTLTLDPNITAANLAAIAPGPPAVANGTALQLAGLGNSTAAADEINGQTILQFYSSIASQVGQQSSAATAGQTLHQSMLAQAQSFRTQVSGVSLDEEAAAVLELQQSYQAASKMVNVIDTLAQSIITMPV